MNLPSTQGSYYSQDSHFPLALQMEMESHRLTLDGMTADLTHTDQLEARLAKVDKLLDHLSQVQERKDAILCQLQTRRPENSLAIHIPYQTWVIQHWSKPAWPVTRPQRRLDMRHKSCDQAAFQMLHLLLVRLISCNVHSCIRLVTQYYDAVQPPQTRPFT